MKNFYMKILLLCFCMLPINVMADEAYMFADLLVWQVSQEANSTWATFIKETNSRTVDFDATNVAFNWDLGFRGGAYYQKRLWDAELFWTYFNTKTNQNFNVDGQIVLPEFFSGFISEDFFFGTGMNWRFTMNMFDLNFGHTFTPVRSFTLRPALGLKGGTIYQTIDCNWFADIYNANEVVKNNFFGVGPSFSLDTTWNLYKHLSIFADFATAFMYGHWSINDTYSRPSALLVTPTKIITSLNTTQLGTIMFDYILGLEWVYSGRSKVTIKLGYEMQFWANQLRIPTFQQLPVSGDLTLQGGTCRIRVDL